MPTGEAWPTQRGIVASVASTEAALEPATSAVDAKGLRVDVIPTPVVGRGQRRGGRQCWAQQTLLLLMTLLLLLLLQPPPLMRLRFKDSEVTALVAFPPFSETFAARLALIRRPWEIETMLLSGLALIPLPFRSRVSLYTTGLILLTYIKRSGKNQACRNDNPAQIEYCADQRKERGARQCMLHSSPRHSDLKLEYREQTLVVFNVRHWRT